MSRHHKRNKQPRHRPTSPPTPIQPTIPVGLLAILGPLLLVETRRIGKYEAEVYYDEREKEFTVRVVDLPGCFVYTFDMFKIGALTEAATALWIERFKNRVGTDS